MFERRRFLQTLATLGAAAAVPGTAFSRFKAYPFTLGVASGYPTSSSVVLWTRLMGDFDPLPIAMRWEIGADEVMKSIVLSGTTSADSAWAHSARVEVQGLQPDRRYWYRFSAGDAQSPIGRTRTAPSAGAAASKLRFAFASCQQYEQGFFGAYRHIVADDPDLIVFLGDYIYDASWGRDLVRSHGAPSTYTLDDYRGRYALYKSDPDLQAAHAACPWIVTWDDHEVVNDYSDDRAANNLDPQRFLRRRAAAYRAYYEHMPLPPSMQPEGANLRLYAKLDWGALARFYMLDDRQYRSWHACPPTGRTRPGANAGSSTVDVAECAEMSDAKRTMLGAAQERWLEGALVESRAAWNILGQQTRMAQFDQLPGPGRRAWTDGWDGYPAARKRLLEYIAGKKVANPVVLGGDVHAFNVSQLKTDFDDARSPVVASEFVGTSITSQGWSQERFNEFLPDNPHMLLAESRHRGYVRVEVTPKLWRADLRAMDTVRTREADCRTLASFVVEDGRAGPLKA
jgi:alkaline phosphatase D